MLLAFLSSEKPTKNSSLGHQRAVIHTEEMADIIVDVLSASGETRPPAFFDTQDGPLVSGVYECLEDEYQEVGQLENCAKVGIERDEWRKLAAGTYTFRLTGILSDPTGERHQLPQTW